MMYMEDNIQINRLMVVLRRANDYHMSREVRLRCCV